MTTPHRLPDFDMSSVRRPEFQPHQPSGPSSARHADGGAAYGVAGHDSALSAASTTPAALSAREAEQRFARLLAESEYKLLEEKSRAHEREARLKDELAREKAQLPKLVNERVEQILRERAVGRSSTTETEESAQLKQQLVETQRLLADAERRYQQEKRELLNLRTTQLKSETVKRGQEGDIIARAMQVMSEYETIVRSSEENSLARLAHHMEAFEREWVNRSKEFEERKAEFESSVMTKAISALKEHNQDVESIGQHVLQKTLELIKAQSSSRLELERQVLEQSEAFKQQYKELCDHEYIERCRAYDAELARRERNLVNIIAEERDRVISHERSAVERSELSHVQVLADAMKEVSQLREQLIREQQQQQEKSLTELIRRRDEMRLEQNKMIDEANRRMQQLEQQCVEAVETAQRAMRDMQLEVTKKDAELAKQSMTMTRDHEKSRIEELNKAREDIEAQWKQVLDEVRTQHTAELRRVHEDTQERFDREHAEQFKREQEVRRSYEAKIGKVEEQMEQRWTKRLVEGNQSLERHLEVISALREDNEQLGHQLSSLQQQLNLRENEFGAKLAAVQREHEQVWYRKMEEMRQRYDQLLDEALGGPHGDSVPRTEHDKVVESLRELEERLVEMKRTENDRIGRERQQLNELWRTRLEQERAERAVWEEDQLKKLSEMRIELEADSRRKETELLRRSEQERIRLHDEAMRRTLEDKRDREAFEDKQREEWHMRVREAEDELNSAYAEKVKILERRFEEKERDVEKQRLNLRSEMSKFEAQSRAQAHEWLEREKETILADVKRFHEKLTLEQERMEENRVLFEQKLSLKYADQFEQAKRELQKRMLDVTSFHIAYWQRCETEWLAFRADEIALMLQFRSEHQARVMYFAQTASEKAQSQAAALLKAEREVLDRKQAEMYAEIEKARLANEAAARDRALRLLEERDKIQEEAEKLRREEETRVWDSLQKKIMEKEHASEADRRILELELRSRYESMVAAERARVDQLMEQHRKEARQLYERHESTIREREEQWHKQRLQIELEEHNSHEQQYHELRTQAENRVAEERRRFEATLRIRELEFEKERQRLLDGLEGQFKQHERDTRTQVAAMKEEHDQRIRAMMIENQGQREQHLMEVAEQERKFQLARDEFEAESQRRFEKAMNEVRNQIDKRTREHQQRELETREQLEKSRRQYEERINQQYEALLKEHEDRLFALQKERDDRVIAIERDHQQSLIGLRSELERQLSERFSASDGQMAAAAENLRRQYQSRLEEFSALLQDERQKRSLAEERTGALRDEMESLRASVEQHKLEIFRSAQTKYDKLLADFKEKSRREREEMARRYVEEEERRLARELVNSDAELKHGIKDDVTRAWESRERVASAIHNSSTVTSGSFAAGGTPRVSQQTASGGGGQAGGATPATATAEDRAALEQIPRRREKLQQLWQVLEIAQEERGHFSDKISALPPARMLDELNGEVRRLEVHLPLLEVVTRREFVQHRLVELSRTPKQSGSAAAQVQMQMEELQKEHDKLTEHLRVELPKFEGRYGTKFMFRGRSLAETLQLEQQASSGASRRR